MQKRYDKNTRKTPKKLGINSDRLKRTATEWRRENHKAIGAYNTFVAKNGCFGDECRGF